MTRVAGHPILVRPPLDCLYIFIYSRGLFRKTNGPLDVNSTSLINIFKGAFNRLDSMSHKKKKKKNQ
jgi:hypothetical protein